MMKSETNWQIWPAEPSPPSAVRDEPLIDGCATEKVKTSPDKITTQNSDKEAATGEDERGDLLIRGFWTAGTDCILDVRVTDTDSKSHCKRTPFKVSESQGKEKTRKYLGACLENRRHFTPFVLSVDCSDEKLKPSRNDSQQNLQENGKSPIRKYVVT
jgi:hypothetical protein